MFLVLVTVSVGSALLFRMYPREVTVSMHEYATKYRGTVEVSLYFNNSNYFPISILHINAKGSIPLLTVYNEQ